MIRTAERAEAQVRAVEVVLHDLRRREYESAMAQGESPRPKDYSEGHYTGFRAGIRAAVDAVAAALTPPPEDGHRPPIYPGNPDTRRKPVSGNACCECGHGKQPHGFVRASASGWIGSGERGEHVGPCRRLGCTCRRYRPTGSARTASSGDGPGVKESRGSSTPVAAPAPTTVSSPAAPLALLGDRSTAGEDQP